MELGTLFLIAILVTLLVLIILQIKRSRRKDDEEWEETPSPYTSTGSYPSVPAAAMRSTITPKPNATPAAAVKKQPVIPQITLYQFPYHGGNAVCPCCDGENDPSYRFCWICGQRMS